jgi:hypothetical protein
MKHTVPCGDTYEIHEYEVEVGYTGRKRTIWEADNFPYFQDTKEDLIEMLDYMTTTWANQRIN